MRRGITSGAFSLRENSMELPTESQMANLKRKAIERRETPVASVGHLPGWKVLGDTYTYQIGEHALRLRAPSINHSRPVCEALWELPLILQIISICGIDKEGVRPDYDRMAEIMTDAGLPVNPYEASAYWRDFCWGDELERATPDLCDALYLLLDNPTEQGYYWPRPAPEAPPQMPEDGDIGQWVALNAEWVAREKEAADSALPAGLRYLDDVILDEFTPTEFATLPVIITDCVGGYPGDVREIIYKALTGKDLYRRKQQGGKPSGDPNMFYLLFYQITGVPIPLVNDLCTGALRHTVSENIKEWQEYQSVGVASLLSSMLPNSTMR